MPIYDFGGKTAIVTGGSRGIGKTIAQRLNGCGAKVWVWDTAPVEDTAWSQIALDVTKPGDIERGLREVMASSVRIDILVNNAGITGGSGPLETFDPATWRRVIDICLVSVFEVCRQVIPLMRTSDHGRIVNMASLAGKEGTPNLSAYAAAKAGVMSLTKSLGKELATTNIRVNSVAPAAIKTEILSQMAPDMVAAMIAKSPMGRLGTVEEVAELVLWLCSEACSFSTGAVFDLSGGRATY
jgi:3-oxoacyl-[acyl-carrier protein] reductase